MKKSLILIISISLSLFTQAQSTSDILISGGFDLIKTDYSRFADKLQLGTEANYFVLRHFAVGAGLELWTRQPSSFAMGVRYYALDNFFVRFRGLISEIFPTGRTFTLLS